jgi:aldose 1-epimerase
MINSPAAISYQKWGEHAGQPVHLFRLGNSTGAYVELCNYGATLVSAMMPDGEGNLGNVVLGYPSLAGYLKDEGYLGATVGRFANRIGGAAVELDGTAYQLQANDGGNTNHGGWDGFNSKVFANEVGEDNVTFIYRSPDGEGGFPGNLELSVTYRFTNDNELRIHFNAVTDRATIANFTNHAYFNLAAKPGNILGHKLKVRAQNMLDTDAAHIPTGLIKPTGSKAWSGDTVGSKMNDDTHVNAGFNYCYLLESTDTLKYAAELTDDTSGRRLEVTTTYPSVMVYTGDYLSSNCEGNFGRPYQPLDGLCLECQYYPDSPNHAHFPSTVLKPGEEYDHTIVYKFGVIN